MTKYSRLILLLQIELVTVSRRMIVFIRFCLVGKLLRLQLFQAYIVLPIPIITTYAIIVKCEGALNIIQAQSRNDRYI